MYLKTENKQSIAGQISLIYSISLIRITVPVRSVQIQRVHVWSKQRNTSMKLHNSMCQTDDDVCFTHSRRISSPQVVHLERVRRPVIELRHSRGGKKKVTSDVGVTRQSVLRNWTSSSFQVSRTALICHSFALRDTGRQYRQTQVTPWEDPSEHSKDERKKITLSTTHVVDSRSWRFETHSTNPSNDYLTKFDDIPCQYQYGEFGFVAVELNRTKESKRELESKDFRTSFLLFSVSRDNSWIW